MGVGAATTPHPRPFLFPRSGTQCQSGCWHPLCIVTALCPGMPGPAAAAGVPEGVTAAREEDLDALSRCSHPHITHPPVWQVEGTHTWLLPHQPPDLAASVLTAPSTCAPAYVTLEAGVSRTLPWT